MTGVFIKPRISPFMVDGMGRVLDMLAEDLEVVAVV